MPLHVTVLAVSGETVLEMMMPSHGTVSTLKSCLHASTNVKRAEQVLILASRSLEDSNVMEDLVWWFVLSDLLGEEAGEFVFELSLTMVVLPKLCGHCAAHQTARFNAAKARSTYCRARRLDEGIRAGVKSAAFLSPHERELLAGLEDDSLRTNANELTMQVGHGTIWAKNGTRSMLGQNTRSHTRRVLEDLALYI